MFHATAPVDRHPTTAVDDLYKALVTCDSQGDATACALAVDAFFREALQVGGGARMVNPDRLQRLTPYLGQLVGPTLSRRMRAALAMPSARPIAPPPYFEAGQTLIQYSDALKLGATWVNIAQRAKAAPKSDICYAGPAARADAAATTLSFNKIIEKPKTSVRRTLLCDILSRASASMQLEHQVLAAKAYHQLVKLKEPTLAAYGTEAPRWLLRILQHPFTNLPEAYKQYCHKRALRLWSDLTDLWQPSIPEACRQDAKRVYDKLRAMQADGSLSSNTPLPEILELHPAVVDGWLVPLGQPQFTRGEATVPDGAKAFLADVRQWRQGAQRHLNPDSLGYLMSGPPGTGKSSFARELASLAKCRFAYRLDSAKMMSKFQHESGGRVHAMFAFVKSLAQKQGPVLLMLDEVDALIAQKTTGCNNESNEITSIVQQELDGLGENILVVGATNHAEHLEAASLRRFVHQDTFVEPQEAEILPWLQRVVGADRTAEVSAALTLIWPTLARVLRGLDWSAIATVMRPASAAWSPQGDAPVRSFDTVYGELLRRILATRERNSERARGRPTLGCRLPTVAGVQALERGFCARLHVPDAVRDLCGGALHVPFAANGRAWLLSVQRREFTSAQLILIDGPNPEACQAARVDLTARHPVTHQVVAALKLPCLPYGPRTTPAPPLRWETLHACQALLDPHAGLDLEITYLEENFDA